MHDRIVILGVSLLVLAAAVGRHAAFELVEGQRYFEQQRVGVATSLGSLRAAIEQQLNESQLLSRSLAAHVALNPEITADQFANLARALLTNRNTVRHVALARNNVVSHIYPKAGNESALGVDYLTNLSQREGALLAMRQRETIVDGPVDLVQGSRAVISRTPIWLPPSDSTGGASYWGLASAVVDLPAFFHAAGLTAPHTGLWFAVRNGQEVLFGDPQVFADSPVLVEIALPGTTWQLAAIPDVGWSTSSPNLLWVRLQAVFMLLIVGLLVLVVLRDQQRIRHMAVHDNLTGLPNRLLLNDRIGQAVAKARRYGQPFAVLNLDLDDFKPVNDRFGHRAGDMVLAQVAKRLLSCMRAVDTVARTGGDEFVILLPDLRGPTDAAAVAGKVIEAMNQPFDVHGQACSLGVSVGIALFPDDGEDSETLVRKADQAMYRAKQGGKNAAAFCQPAAALTPAG